jgi:hypothetical protein
VSSGISVSGVACEVLPLPLILRSLRARSLIEDFRDVQRSVGLGSGGVGNALRSKPETSLAEGDTMVATSSWRSRRYTDASEYAFLYAGLPFRHRAGDALGEIGDEHCVLESSCLEE